VLLNTFHRLLLGDRMGAQDKAQTALSIAGNADKAYWLATAVALGNPKTRSAGLKMASYGARVTFNMARASAGAALGTPLVRGGTSTLGGLATAATVGYVAGAAIGTGIGYAMDGKHGAGNAIALYTGQVSFDEYTDVVGNAIKQSI
jgi:hypothetical protein